MFMLNVRPVRRAAVLAALAWATLTLVACEKPQQPATAASIDTAGMDRSVQPGDNFFEYANGTWVKTTPIPPDLSAYGSFTILAELTDRRVADLIQETAKADNPAGSDARKIGDFYSTFLDQAAIDSAGLAPLQPTLDSIAAVRNRTDLARMLGANLRADVDPLNATNFFTENLFGLWIAQDFDDPTQYVPYLLQGGLGMPDRSYYVDSSASMTVVRTKYRQHVAAMLTLAGISNADARADRIVALETRMARAHWTRQESGDLLRNNTHWSRADFASKAPGLDWGAFFAAAGLAAPQTFVLWQSTAITGLSALTASEPLDAWKDWLTYHAIQSRHAVLPSAFGAESFAFNGVVLSGAQEAPARWKTAVTATNAALGFAVGKLYAERYFPASDKARAEEMVANLMAAFRDRIDHLEWMAPSTKAEAKAKLAVLKVGIGYPDVWPSYADLQVVAGDAYGNTERASLFRLHRSLARLGQPVDRGEWVMTPQTVNAVNMPAMNAMNFPAAILQAPFFDAARPASLNYGGMGAVIGHEISHSFDNMGALFDSQGRLRNWWTPEDLKHFEASSAQLARQYDAYRPFPDLAVNGQQTLSENIADLAGLTAAYDAYHLSLGGKRAPKIEGFTEDQQFFLSFGQIWRVKFREPALRRRVLTDGHAPGEYRSFTVRNLDAWYQPFDVVSGQALYLAPADRVRIW
jgi:putative endopeptidase